MVEHEETMTESSVVKRIQRQPPKASKSPEFVETESDDSDDEEEEQEPVVKRIQKLTKKASKSAKLANTDREDSDDDKEEKESVFKTVPKFSWLVEIDPENSRDSDTEDTLRAMGNPIDKSLEVGKNEEEPVLKKGIYRSENISHVVKFDINYLKKVLTSSGVEKHKKRGN